MDFSDWLQMKNSGRLCTEKESGKLQMENYSIKLYTWNSSLFQMENVSGESFAAGE